MWVLHYVACSTGSGYSCHIGLDAVESYLILRAVVLAYIYGICFTTPCRAAVVAPRVGIWTSHAVTQLGVHSWVEVHSSVGVACHHCILVPSVLSCHIWSNGNHMQGNLFYWLGAVVCNWGSSWRVQIVCDHYHCDWCWLLDACHGRLHPQVWSCGRLVPRHAEWPSGSW